MMLTVSKHFHSAAAPDDDVKFKTLRKNINDPETLNFWKYMAVVTPSHPDFILRFETELRAGRMTVTELKDGMAALTYLDRFISTLQNLYPTTFTNGNIGPVRICHF
jgi:hypothetical protein